MKRGDYIRRGTALSLTRLLVWWSTLRRRLYLSLIWEIGKHPRFEGAVYIASFGGTVRLGNNVWFGPNVNVSASRGATLVVGDNVYLGAGTFVISRSSVVIGKDTMVGEYVSIRDNDHQWRDPSTPVAKQGFVSAPVRIGDDVWIGRGASILKGVTIGDGAVIGSNALVMKDVPAFAVAVGVPAVVVAMRSRPLGE